VAEVVEETVCRPGPPDGRLDASVTVLEGIGDKRAALLANLGITTVGDLLFHFPRAYDDRRSMTAVADVAEGDTVTIEAEVVSARVLRMRRRMSAAEALLRDESGTIKSVWFGQSYIARQLTPGKRGLFSGVVGKWKGPALRNPDFELFQGDEDDQFITGRIVPIYRLTEKVTQRMLRRCVRTALDTVDAPLAETLSDALREAHGFPGVNEALRAVHLPEDPDAARLARNRFAYEELLGIQLGVLSLRAARHHEVTGYQHTVDGHVLSRLRDALPFSLTGAQERAVEDILDDMASARPMLRLIQGDVGCGKTIVALHAVAAAADGRYQTAIMAPTEILAEQHTVSMRALLEPLGLRVAVLTGSTRGAKEVCERVAAGDVDVIVGTHALIQDRVTFHALGLAIIDEQHRFGVMQRSALVEKGLNGDILHMTATPIPRTLAITVYGGMDLSVIDEMPPSRQPVKTRRITEAKVPGLYTYLIEQAGKGLQTYFVCPLVEESTRVDLAAVTTQFEELSQGPLADLRVGLVHGRLTSQERDAVMRRFKDGELDVLFSTTVIEVGIDCPNATTMVIQDAAQFGLTQLHQLRGRVGRGAEKSHCFLLGKHKTPDGKKRLDILTKTTSGFDIAESDLEMRGPGEFLGVRQAGLSDLHVADLIRDVRLLDAARRDAAAILERDPTLADPTYAHQAAMAARFRDLNA
jgi:ATP-dependent DNA helicase RecG